MLEYGLQKLPALHAVAAEASAEWATKVCCRHHALGVALEAPRLLLYCRCEKRDERAPVGDRLVAADASELRAVRDCVVVAVATGSVTETVSLR